MTNRIEIELTDLGDIVLTRTMDPSEPTMKSTPVYGHLDEQHMVEMLWRSEELHISRIEFHQRSGKVIQLIIEYQGNLEFVLDKLKLVYEYGVLSTVLHHSELSRIMPIFMKIYRTSRIGIIEC